MTALPQTIGPFDICDLLGRGGMGEVWRAVHRGSGVAVAIKGMTGDRARHPAYRSLFEAEVRAVARLDHPGIVRVLDTGQLDEAPWLAMELASGALDQQPRPASWDALRAILLPVLDALAHAHAR